MNGQRLDQFPKILSMLDKTGFECFAGRDSTFEPVRNTRSRVWKENFPSSTKNFPKEKFVRERTTVEYRGLYDLPQPCPVVKAIFLRKGVEASGREDEKEEPVVGSSREKEKRNGEKVRELVARARRRRCEWRFSSEGDAAGLGRPGALTGATTRINRIHGAVITYCDRARRVPRGSRSCCRRDGRVWGCWSPQLRPLPSWTD